MIFIDTWAWLALANKKDSNHEAVKVTYEKIKDDQIISSTFIMDELITLLFRSVDFEKAVLFLDAIFTMSNTGKLLIIEVDSNLLYKAWEYRKKYSDKPYISFTDFTSFVIMKERGIKRVFTGDRHFEMINMGFVIER